MGWKRWASLAAWAATVAATVATTLVANPATAQVGDEIRLQGRLLSAGGSPVPDGDYGVTLRFYKSDKDATKDALTVYVDPGVKVTSGAFAISVGSKTKLNLAPFLSGDAAWVGVQVGSDPELPRLPMHQVPYALRAKQATALSCSGCVATGHLAKSVLAPYAKTAQLTIYAKSADLAKVASTGAYSDLKGAPTQPQLKTCPAGQALSGYKIDGSPVCVAAKAYSGKDFALSNQSCASGQVLKGIDAAGKAVCVNDSAPKSPADGMSSGQVNNLKASKLANGSTPWTSASSHKHTYDVNSTWLREGNDDASFKAFGNKRQMAFRTDGTSEYAKGIGAYPFVWTYGGDAASNRRMMLATDGGLWTSKYGWLDGKFQAKGSYVPANQTCPSGQVLRGFSSSGAKVCVTDKDTNTTYSGKNFALSNQACPSGQVLRGFTSAGAKVCVTDKDTNSTYSGKNFALSNQACPSGQVLRGFSSTGGKLCVTDKDTNTTYSGKNFALSNQACPSGQVLRGFSSTGGKLCVTDKDSNTTYSGKNFALSNKSCPSGYFQYGVSSSGSPLCRNSFAANFNANSKRLYNLANPSSSTDAANKGYVDSAIASNVSAQPGVQNSKRVYTGVIVLRGGSCPSGWTSESVNSVRGPNGWTYVNINEKGVFIGGMNGRGYGHEQIYASFKNNEGPATICTKQFNASAGKPHVSMMFRRSSGSCPSGYFGLSTVSHLRGNNNWAYAMANDSGFYLGYINAWSYGSRGEDADAGWMRRWFRSSEVDLVCVKVMGVDEDSPTKNGVYPVFVGVKSQAACPSGWTYRTTSQTNGGNGYFYLQANRAATFWGGLHDWSHGGAAQQNLYFHYSHVPGICYRYYKANGNPYASIRTPHSGSCPSGHTTFAAANVKGWNNTGYIQMAGNALYLGGLYGWSRSDYGSGFVQHTYSSEVSNRLCLRMFNAN